MRRKDFFLFLLIIYFFTGARLPENTYAYPPQNGSVIQSLGADIYDEFLTSHKILTQAENPEVDGVKNVSNRIIEAVNLYYKTKKLTKALDGFHWEINLVEAKKSDGWCLPGGKIAIYSPFLNVTQSDGSLAVVVAHEIAHVLLKHGDARMKQYLKQYLGVKDLASSLSAKPVETKDFYRMAFGNGDYVGVIRGFTPQEEIEADDLAAVFCAMAGYKAQEAIVFMERMVWFKNTGRTPEFFLTHPVDENRIPHLKEVVDDIQRNYYKPITKN